MDQGKFVSTQELLLFVHSFGGARGVMVIVPGYEHGDTSSIPGQN